MRFSGIILLLFVVCLQAEATSIPYPNGSIYVNSGLTSALSWGLYRVSGIDYEKANLFQWQGEGAFYYRKFISGGVSAQIKSGPPDDSSTQIENNYHVFTRLHQRFGSMAVFIGPGAGLHFLEYVADLALPSDSALPDENEVNQSVLEVLMKVGLGLRLSSLFGIHGSAIASHSWETESKLLYTGGLSIDLNYFFKHFRQYTKGFFLNMEWQAGKIWDTKFPQKSKEWSLSAGSSVAF